MKSIVQIRAVAAFAFAAFVHNLMAGYDAAGGYVTLLAHNLGSKGESTFMTNIVKSSSYGWSDGRDPHPGTNYYCGVNQQLCTPKVDGGTFSFPGDSLTIGYRLIVLASSTLNVGNLSFEKGGYIMSNGGGSRSVTLQGSLTVLGSSTKPSGFHLGMSPQWYKVESAFKGDSSSFAYSELGESVIFSTFATQYVELDDADEYEGTFEVRTNTCLRIGSDMPGRVVVANGGCLTPVSACVLGTLSLQDGAVLGTSHSGLITVADSFSVSGRVTLKSLGGVSFPRALLVVPEACGMLDEGLFIGDGVRFSVCKENGVQTLYAEPLEASVFDGTTGYVKQIKGGVSVNSALKNIFDEPSAWSDDRTLHSDTNYYARWLGIYITTNSVFAGRSLTLDHTLVRFKNNISVNISDLRVLEGSYPDDSIFSSSGDGGKYYLAGGMSVLSRLTDRWPFAFYGGNDGQTWITSQKITGSSTRAFELRGNMSKAPGAVFNYVEFHGDLSEYSGTMIVGTNFTARLGGSTMPGTIRLDTAYSHLDTMAADGAEVNIGTLKSMFPTSISVAQTNTLAVSDALSVTGTLTKNGGGILAAGGIAAPCADAVLNVVEGGIRADSAYAFDGIRISFADGVTYVCDCASADTERTRFGLYNTASVAASGALNVDIRNLNVEELPQEVALFTVPSSDAEALAEAIRFTSRPKGCVIEKIVVDAGSGQKIIKAILNVAGFKFIVR